jgi:secreted Zn-dependent insulinase-like peptidase
VRLKSKEKHKQLSIIFEIDWNLHDFYKKSVEIVLEHISHNGPESFQRYLKNNNFITEISTSLLEQTDEQCVIEIEMNLTENGYFKR